MKNYKLLLLAMLAMALTISACKDDDDPEPTPEVCVLGENGTVQFNITWQGQTNDLDLVNFRRNGNFVFSSEYESNDIRTGGGVEYIRYTDTLRTDTFALDITYLALSGSAPYTGCVKTATAETNFSGTAEFNQDNTHRFAVGSDGSITVLN